MRLLWLENAWDHAKKKHSAIRSEVRKNDPPIVKNSQHTKKQANPSFTPMKAVSETKAIDAMGMLGKVKLFTGLSQANALEQ